MSTLSRGRDWAARPFPHWTARLSNCAAGGLAVPTRGQTGGPPSIQPGAGRLPPTRRKGTADMAKELNTNDERDAGRPLSKARNDTATRMLSLALESKFLNADDHGSLLRVMAVIPAL